MKKRVRRKKVTKRQLRDIFTEAQQRQIRLDSANQILTAAAQVLIDDFGFAPDQCVDFAGKVSAQIQANNEALRDEAAEDTAVEEE